MFDGVIEVSYSPFCLTFVEREVLGVSSYKHGFVYFPLQFYQFWPHMYYSSTVLCIHTSTAMPSW